MTSKKDQSADEEKPWDPEDVIEVIDVHPPKGDDFKIIRTTEADPYDDPLPPAKHQPRKNAAADSAALTTQKAAAATRIQRKSR